MTRPQLRPSPSPWLPALLILLGLLLLSASCTGTPAEAAPAPSPQHGSCATEPECEALCTADDEQACLRLAHILAEGFGREPNRSAARAVLARQCSRGSAQACLRLAGVAQEGSASALAFQAKAETAATARCVLGGAQGCAVRATLATQNGSPDVRYWLVVACVRGDASSCAQATDDMSMDATFADWELFDYIGERHEALREYGCSSGRAVDCRELGIWRDDDTLRRRAAHLYVADCVRGYGPSCYRAAELHEELGDSEAAAIWMKNACRRGLKRACAK